MRRISYIWVLWFWLLGSGGSALAQQKFPPPEFQSGYKMPDTTAPAARAAALQYVDVAVLAACLGIATWLVYRNRSRRGMFWLSLFSLAYFGFYRKGCICPIGSPQNIAYGFFEPGYAVPFTVLAFFALPLLFALFSGRVFCGGVCPQGALQDFLLIKPLKVPAWLEGGLGIIPYLFLGAGLAFAATGTGFVICRYDPFVPLFRLNGSSFILSISAVFLVLSTVIGRPYCRFLCPYGALLKTAGQVSKWRVRVTPNSCDQCRLCENSCPFGAMREPSAPTTPAAVVNRERGRLGWLLVALPLLILAGAWAGSKLGPVAAKVHPAVAQAERYVSNQTHPVNYGPMTPEALSLAKAEEKPQTVIDRAIRLRQKFTLAMAIFGAWAGLVIGLKLVALTVRPLRTDFEPDRGSCFACARCFSSCPNEQIRRGLTPRVAPCPS